MGPASCSICLYRGCLVSSSSITWLSLLAQLFSGLVIFTVPHREVDSSWGCCHEDGVLLGCGLALAKLWSHGTWELNFSVAAGVLNAFYSNVCKLASPQAISLGMPMELTLKFLKHLVLEMAILLDALNDRVTTFRSLPYGNFSVLQYMSSVTFCTAFLALSLSNTWAKILKGYGSNNSVHACISQSTELSSHSTKAHRIDWLIILDSARGNLRKLLEFNFRKLITTPSGFITLETEFNKCTRSIWSGKIFALPTNPPKKQHAWFKVSWKNLEPWNSVGA